VGALGIQKVSDVTGEITWWITDKTSMTYQALKTKATSAAEASLGVVYHFAGGLSNLPV
jgi:hypothetical protein